MTNSKMTKKDWFEVLRGVVAESETAQKDGALEFINHEIELLARKSGHSTMTKTQKENEIITTFVLGVLNTLENPVTISELLEVEEIAAYTLEDGRKLSNQKLSAILKKLVDDKKVNKAYEKKKAYFSVDSSENVD